MTFRFTLNTLIICIIYIVEKTGCYKFHPIKTERYIIVSVENTMLLALLLLGMAKRRSEDGF